MKRIYPPRDRFWADPFVIFKNNTHYIFFEEFSFRRNRGVISVIELKENGQHTKSKVVLSRDYHLSYPFLFEENGVLYMIPETSQNNTVELYKCAEFPMKWELETVLIDNIKTVDTTLFKRDGVYWLFTNEKVVENSENWNTISIYSSKDLLSGKWKPHPKNPIIKDTPSARPAGKLFKEGNRIYRPSQNCEKHYGYGMVINEINQLDENSYDEKSIQSINPDWSVDLISTHTFNFERKLTVIDALIKRKRRFPRLL